MIADGYPREDSVPTFLGKGEDEESKKMIVNLTLEQLLPMSFGPEHLAK
jgi:hypothetical protein